MLLPALRPLGIIKSFKMFSIFQNFEISKKYDCAFIDLNSIAIPSYIDGLHFEPSEHEKIAKIIFEHL